MNEIEKSKLITVFNDWVMNVGTDKDLVSNEMKLYLISSFPQMLKQTFPKKTLFGGL
jgi:hypothetical protein